MVVVIRGLVGVFPELRPKKGEKNSDVSRTPEQPRITWCRHSRGLRDKGRQKQLVAVSSACWDIKSEVVE